MADISELSIKIKNNKIQILKKKMSLSVSKTLHLFHNLFSQQSNNFPLNGVGTIPLNCFGLVETVQSDGPNTAGEIVLTVD